MMLLARRFGAFTIVLSLFCFAMILRAATPGAEELLSLGRKAIGTEVITGRLNSVEVTGKFVFPVSGRSGTVTAIGKQPITPNKMGKARFRLLMPDRFRQDYSYTAGDGGFVLMVSTTTRDGGDVWLQRHAADSFPPGVTMATNIVPAPPVDEGKRKEVRFQHARFLLALLLYVDSSLPINFTEAGVAEAPDGKADVLDGTGPDGFSVRLFLDQKTHIPLMLTYPDVASGKTEELRLGDYEKTAGVLFPHLLSFSTGGNLTQEIRFEKYEVNAKISPQDFQKEAK